MSHKTWMNLEHVLVVVETEDPDYPVEWEIIHPPECTHDEHVECPIGYEVDAIGVTETMFGSWMPSEFLTQPLINFGEVAVEVGRQLLHSDLAKVSFGAKWWGGFDYWGEWDYGFEFWVNSEKDLGPSWTRALQIIEESFVT